MVFLFSTDGTKQNKYLYNTPMRLNKYIASAGVCSRRKADELIAAGEVRVGGEVISALGYDYDESSALPVEVCGKQIKPSSKKIYIALNKPNGYITTASDERGRKTVMELLPDTAERLFPIGRLDADTTGLLLFTNDGDFAYKLSHPKHALEKTYRAKAAGSLSKEKLAKLENGIELDGRRTAPAKIEILKEGKNEYYIEIKIHEGRNRQIRRMFEAVNCKVVALERTRIGSISLGKLLPGHTRKLNEREIASLMLQ